MRSWLSWNTPFCTQPYSLPRPASLRAPVSTVGGQCSMVNMGFIDSWHIQPRLNGCLVSPWLCPQVVKLPYLLFICLGTNQINPTLSKILETFRNIFHHSGDGFLMLFLPWPLGPRANSTASRYPGRWFPCLPWYGSPYFRDHALLWFGGTLFWWNMSSGYWKF